MTLDNIDFLILQILNESGFASSYRIAEKLKSRGLNLDSRTVRYRINRLVEMGLVKKQSRGAFITDEGLQKLKIRNVFGRLGEFSEKIDENVFTCTFNLAGMKGTVPTNTAIIDKSHYEKVRDLIIETSKAPFIVSELLVVRDEGEEIEGYSIPEGHFAISVISNTIYDVILRNAGINLQTEFAGLLFWKNGPLGITDVISYRGTTLSPGLLLMRSGLTSVWRAVKDEGYIIVAIRSLSRYALEIAKIEMERAHARGLKGLINAGEAEAEFCNSNLRAMLVISAGLNYIAPIVENGIHGELLVNELQIDYREFRKPDMAFK